MYEGAKGCAQGCAQESDRQDAKVRTSQQVLQIEANTVMMQGEVLTDSMTSLLSHSTPSRFTPAAFAAA